MEEAHVAHSVCLTDLIGCHHDGGVSEGLSILA